MYYIIVYDVNEKRVAKALKLMRQYLTWVQNSVFEGELSDASLLELKVRLSKLLKPEEDSVLIYSMNEKWMGREAIGIEKNTTDPFI
jgi:CRISPR-associated protein Cas2